MLLFARSIFSSQICPFDGRWRSFYFTSKEEPVIKHQTYAADVGGSGDEDTPEEATTADAYRQRPGFGGAGKGANVDGEGREMHEGNLPREGDARWGFPIPLRAAGPSQVGMAGWKEKGPWRFFGLSFFDLRVREANSGFKK